MSEVSISEIAQLIREHDDFVLCGHVSPDGDCIGSQLAFAALLKRMSKRVTNLLANNDELDYGLLFLSGIKEMIPAADFKGTVGMFVTLDVPTAERMGDAAAKLHALAPASLTIDHHLSERAFSDNYIIDSSAASCSLLVWDIARELGFDNDVDIATCCYTGVLTDTGRFQYQNTDARALVAAGQMVQAGTDPAYVAREIYQNRSRQSLALEARMLNRIEYICDGQVALSYLLRSDFVETGAQKSDAEPLIDTLRSVRGIRVACMLRQMGDSVRGSLRAKDDTDVASIASSFGGGGHRAAAGFTFKGDMDQARKSVTASLREIV